MVGVRISADNIDRLYFTQMGSAMQQSLSGLGFSEIIHFSHWRIFMDGSYSLLTNEPGFSAMFLKNKFYKNSFAGTPDDYSPGLYFYDDLIDESNKAQVWKIKKACMDYYGFKPDILYIDKGKDFADLYCFGTRSDFQPVCSFYLNRVKDIIQFTRDFKIQARKLLREAYQEPLILPGQNDNLTKLAKPEWCKIHGSSEEEGLSLHNSLSTIERIFPLTVKELAVVDQLMQGFSVKEISAYFNSSPRTVEKHIANLKRKTNSRTLVHLVSILFSVA